MDHTELTGRSAEVYRCFARGLTVPQIAEELGISPRTVVLHRNNLKLKLGLASSHDLLVHAMQSTAPTREPGTPFHLLDRDSPIVVVEDNEDDSQAIQRAIQKSGNTNPIVAFDEDIGQEIAFEIVSQPKVDGKNMFYIGTCSGQLCVSYFIHYLSFDFPFY